MKTNEQMIEDLIKRKEIYDKKQAVKRRRIALISAALAIILIASSVPVIALVTANKKTPIPPEVTGEAVTDEVIITDTETSLTTEENADTISFEPIKDEIIEHIGYAMKLSAGESHIFPVCCFSWLMGGEVKLTLEEHGLNCWRTRGWNFYNKYYIEGNYKDNLSKVDNHTYAYVPSVYYGKKESGDIHEFDLTIVYDHKAEVNKLLIYLEADGAEILSSKVIKVQTVDFPEEEKYNYLTYYIKYRFTENHSLARIYPITFYTEDQIAKAEELINNGEQIITAKRAYMHQVKITEELSYERWVHPVTLFKIRDTVFVCRLEEELQYMYDLAAVYFGDIDKSNTPLYMMDLYMPDYYECPWCVSKREEMKKN